MPYLNTVTIMGHVTKDVEPRNLPDGTPAAAFTLGVNKTWKDKNGEKKEKASFIGVKCFGGWATSAARMKKGALCLVAGELVQESWEKDGKQQSKTLVQAKECYQLLTPPRDDAPAPKTQAQHPLPIAPKGAEDDGEIPF